MQRILTTCCLPAITAAVKLGEGSSDNIEALCGNTDLKSGGWRLAVTVEALTSLLASSTSIDAATLQNYSALFLWHAVALQHIPLEFRAFPQEALSNAEVSGPEPPADLLAAFLAALAPHLRTALHVATSYTGIETEAVRSGLDDTALTTVGSGRNVADLVDVRLLRVLYVLLPGLVASTKSSGSGSVAEVVATVFGNSGDDTTAAEAAASALQAAFAAVSARASLPSTWSPVSITSEADNAAAAEFQEALASAADANAVDEPQLPVPVSGFIDTVVGDSESHAAVSQFESADADAETFPMPFGPDFKWHTGENDLSNLPDAYHDDSSAATGVQNDKALRQNQRKASNLQKKGASLSGSVIKKTKTIVERGIWSPAIAARALHASVTANEAKGKGKGKKGKTKNKKSWSGNKGKKGKVSKAALIQQANNERILAEGVARAEGQLATLEKTVQLSASRDRYEDAMAQLAHFDAPKLTGEVISDEAIAVNMEFQAVRLEVMLEWNQWTMRQLKLGKGSTSGLGSWSSSPASLLYAAAAEALGMFSQESLLRPPYRLPKVLVQIFTVLGFTDVRDNLFKSLPAEAKRGFKLLATSTSGVSPARFQLDEGGAEMPRSVGGSDDPRVPFRPDDWQRELLTIVDHQESALVVAPTSSGKTFICFYAMERVLEQDSEGVLVYIAPTKQLVNQVLAEVYGRFNKTYKTGGKQLAGIFTRDYSFNVDTCQILITVPECAEVLLLSGQRQDLVSRIRFFVFDEVHNILSDNGHVWEHLLCLVNVPLLALSATIGNPAQFAEWLRRLDAERNRKLHVITHSERYNDLKLLQWGTYNHHATPLRDQEDGKMEEIAAATGADATVTMFGGSALHDADSAGLGDNVPPAMQVNLNEYMEEFLANRNKQANAVSTSYLIPDDVLVDIHPAATLDSRSLHAAGAAASTVSGEGVESGAILLPEDTTPLFDGIKAAVEAEGTQALKNKYSERIAALDPDAVFAEAHRVTMAEAHAYGRKLLLLLGDLAHDDEDIARGVILKLGGRLPAAFADYDMACGRSSPMAYLHREVFHVVSFLHERRMLPALIFHLNRRNCEYFAATLVSVLERLEHQYRLRTGWYDILRAAIAELAKLDNQISSLQADPRAQQPATPQYEKLNALLSRRRELPDVHQIDRKFAFWPASGGANLEDMRDAYGWRRMNMDNLMKDGRLKALMRGIGVHHAGMGRSYRSAVEQLFRRGKLQVVLCTATLSQGVHMPCRTVVIAADSPHLHAMTYRQMSGRAGRRGFDKRGCVVFLGVPKGKVYRLVSCTIPPLLGSAPLSTTLVLRMLRAHHLAEPKFRPMLVGGLGRLLRLPFLATQNEMVTEQQLHHLRFSINFLKSAHFATEEGLPSDMAGLVSHIFFTGPSAFVFCTLLRVGFFDVLVKEHEAGPERDLALLKVLAWLFGRTPLHPIMATRSDSFTKSEVLMHAKDVDARARAVVTDYNRRTLDLYHTHLQAYVRAREGALVSAAKLPASGIQFPTSRPHAGVESCASTEVVKAAPKPASGAGSGAGAGTTAVAAVAVVEEVVEEKKVEKPLFTASAGGWADSDSDDDSSDGGMTFGGGFAAALAQKTAPAKAEQAAAQKKVVAKAVPSKAKAVAAPAEKKPREETTSLYGVLAQASNKCRVRSPFLALRGEGDRFGTLLELAHSVRSGVQVDTLQVPVFDEGNALLNNYIVDYFTHEYSKALYLDNGLSDGEAWEALKHFGTILKSLAKALAKRNSRSTVSEAFAELALRFYEKFEAWVRV